ncbi:MAG TPA: alpha/beta fold hydrolase [Gammaproteobacteria bacterium]|nr:alpha/beta fold hydrolase [Gammaproteobacteria bacterium]
MQVGGSNEAQEPVASRDASAARARHDGRRATGASLVIVHGLWMNSLSMEPLRRRFAARGFAAHVFRYPSVSHGLEANAARLADFVAAVPGDTVHFVGHSLGGVLIGAMLERAQVGGRARRVVCLGSPFAGSAIGARVARWGPLGSRCIGRSIGDLNACGGFPEWRAPQELGVIAGNRPYGFGRLLGGFDEPNDGTVAIAETHVRGAADHIVLPVTHMSMLWSRLVLDQALAFLETGRFRRAPSPAVR